MSTGDTPKRSLLGLPGELRNRIYWCAREDDPVGYRSNRPLFLSLAHTCRQIRQEFRPIYMGHTVFRMPVLDTFAFITAFIAPHDENAHANIIVNFNSGLQHLETNLLPLMKDLRRFPHIVARAQHYNNKYEYDLCRLLDVNNVGGQWFDGFASKLLRITIRSAGFHRLDVNFYLKRYPGSGELSKQVEANQIHWDDLECLKFKWLRTSFKLSARDR